MNATWGIGLSLRAACYAAFLLSPCSANPDDSNGFCSAGLQFTLPAPNDFTRSFEGPGIFLLSQDPAETKPAGEAKLEGQIRAITGEPLAGVVVRVEKDRAGFSSSTRTDASGTYVLSASGQGSYRLTVEKSGFRRLVLEAITLNAGEKKHLNAVLERLPAATGKTESPGSNMEFSDAPNFTVAGVTDWSNVGLHGSDANVRTSDALAKETAALKSATAEKSSTVSASADAHRLAGDAKKKNGDPVGAVNEYGAAVRLDPSEENYFAWGAELLLHRAGLAAVQVFRRGAEVHPQSSRMRAGLGAAYYANGQYTEAAGQMCQASDLNPADPQPYLFLGKMEKAAADLLPCSEEKLARFANEQPGNAQANFYYGLVLWKRARKTQSADAFAAAERRFHKAIAIDPSLGEAYLQLGMLHNARGEKEAAIAAFQKAVSTTPNLSAAHYQLSLAYRRAGDLATADEEMKSYDELRRSEDAQLEKERRELRQFVTILKDGQTAVPH